MNLPIAFIIFVSLILVASSYVLVSIRDKNIVDYLTPTVTILIVSSYLLPTIDSYTNGQLGSTYAYFYYYAAISIPILTSALVYFFAKPMKIGWGADLIQSKNMRWIFLAFSAIIYAPILIKYSSLLASPRDIYQQSRSGEGIYFFTSILVLDISFIYFLFEKNKKTWNNILFLLIATGLGLLHGSKSLTITFYWLYLLHAVYIEHRKFSLLKVGIVLSIPAFIISALFIVLQGSSINILLDSMVKYADYSKNAMLVVDDRTMSPHYGKFVLESNLYGRIPRIFFPGKPDFYGSFRVASRYYSESDLRGVGSPDFSVGLYYYDFGIFAIFYLSAWSAATTYILKGLVHKSNTDSSKANFLLIAFISGVGLIQTGESYTLPEHFILAYALALQAKCQFKFLE